MFMLTCLLLHIKMSLQMKHDIVESTVVLSYISLGFKFSATVLCVVKPPVLTMMI